MHHLRRLDVGGGERDGAGIIGFLGVAKEDVVARLQFVARRLSRFVRHLVHTKVKTTRLAV